MGSQVQILPLRPEKSRHLNPLGFGGAPALAHALYNRTPSRCCCGPIIASKSPCASCIDTGTALACHLLLVDAARQLPPPSTQPNITTLFAQRLQKILCGLLDSDRLFLGHHPL
ncbi:protein of unknown function [Aminobacter niigataensis]|nr:protein of unknown function [Aminobacter niigataensis]